MNRNVTKVLMGSLLLIQMQESQANTIEKMGTAIEKVLNTKKAIHKTVDVNGKPVDLYLNESEPRVAVIQKVVYPPDCTHTWVIGMNGETAKVSQIRVVEMSCPHALPCSKSVYLDQYKGKGPADLRKLKDDVQAIAKATGTSNLTTDAVITSVKAVQKLTGRAVAKERN